jgi:hypothetical protein
MNQFITSHRKKMLKYEIEIMEDLIPCLKGEDYFEAKRKYLKLLQTYETDFGKSELFYLKRSE